MGWFTDWLFEPVEEERADNTTTQQVEVTPPADDVLLKALLNNETITREKAMTLPAVSGAVDFISNCVASMPVKLYKYKKDKVEEVEDDPRVAMLNGDTGDTLDGWQMKKAMVEDYLMGQGGYCYIRKIGNEVTGLFYVEDMYVEVWKNYDPINKDFKLLVAGKEYKPYEFIKLLRNTKDGASGVGLTSQISKELETAYQTMLYQLGMVKSGGNKKGFLKSQKKLGQEEINVLKQAWTNMYANNTENVVVLNNGLEFQESSNSAVEMQLNDSKRTLVAEINDLFHISADFYETFKFAIYPIIKAFETALNRDLLLEKEKKNYFFEFDVKEIVKANITERFNAYKVAKETGFMTFNEIRQAENMNWIDGMDVINVGLGAVLYDIDKKQYFTPNTGQTTEIGQEPQVPQEGINPQEAQMDDMMIDHDIISEYEASGNSSDARMRFNPNHNAKDGRFTTGTGGVGGSVGGGSDKETKIKELESQMAETKGLLAKDKIKTQIDMLKDDFQGTPEEYKAMKAKQHDEAVKKSLEKQAKETAQFEKAEADRKKTQYEEYDKFKDDKVESKTSEQKVNDLKEMRKEYSTQKEFEQSFTKLYHGGSKESVESINKNVEIMSVNEKEQKYGDVSGGNIYGLSTATNENSAKVFSESRNNKNVAELYMSKNAKIYTLPKDQHIDNMTYKEVNELSKKGFDAISVGGDENEMRILNPNVVYTKSQIKEAGRK